MGLLPARAVGSSGRRRHHAVARRPAGRGPASATCRRAATSSRTSPWRRTCNSASAARPGPAVSTRCSTFPPLRGILRAKGRRPVRRRAAEAGHRPRPAHETQAPPPRRADRGYPAVDRPADRGVLAAIKKRARDGDPARRAVSRFRAAAGRLVRSDGKRRNRRLRPIDLASQARRSPPAPGGLAPRRTTGGQPCTSRRASRTSSCRRRRRRRSPPARPRPEAQPPRGRRAHHRRDPRRDPRRAKRLRADGGRPRRSSAATT